MGLVFGTHMELVWGLIKSPYGAHAAPLVGPMSHNLKEHDQLTAFLSQRHQVNCSARKMKVALGANSGTNAAAFKKSKQDTGRLRFTF